MSYDFSSLLYPYVFDAETTRLMAVAHDAALRMLHDKGQPAVVREVIARKIIDLAGAGERDPNRLARHALEDLGLRINIE